MNALRFISRIDVNNMIKVPDIDDFKGRELEVILVPISGNIDNKKNGAELFINKWTGVLNNDSNDRIDFLVNKYQ